MSDATADAALYRFTADMLDAYGEDWPDRLIKNLKFDPAAANIELPPPVDDPADMQVMVLLRVSWPDYERLKAAADAADTTIEDLVLARALTDPSTTDS
ncbi:hypothetical protein ACFXHA_43270 [Nocardia sp. NPDC059240]|uniref:hypothetical protein n=1 Tax=Nocardia sp. NPDC059240 TaxID=3346786 RepID=UPI0036754E55